jgi:hypothetical protein
MLRTSSVLPMPGDALEERVALGQDGDDDLPDDLVVPDDGLADLARQRFDVVPEFLRLFFDRHME